MPRGQVIHATGIADGASARRSSGRRRSKSAEDGDSEPPARRFLDRKQLASRWQSSISTLKRREAAGELKPTRLGPRTVRYAMAHILEIEERGL